MRNKARVIIGLIIFGLFVPLVNADILPENEFQSSYQNNRMDTRINVGTKGTVFEVIIENTRADESHNSSYWLLKIERAYLPIVFIEGINANLVSGSEIEIKEIDNGKVTKYVLTKHSEGYQRRHSAGDRGAGGDLLLVPIYRDSEDAKTMSGLDWLALGKKIAAFYKDISKGEYDLTIVDVAQTIRYAVLGCDLSVGWVDNKLLAQGFDPETYNHVIYLYPPHTCSNGFGIYNGNRSATDLFNVKVTTHEIGHNLGWKHANSEGVEYGNYLSVMGRGAAGYNPAIWPNVDEFEEIVPKESIDLKFPMKPSVNQIRQVGWKSIMAASLNQLSQDVILAPLSANGEKDNYIDLKEYSGYLEYRCALGVDTEAVSAYPDYRNGLFYYNSSGDLVDSDKNSDKHYLQPGQTYNKGIYKISYSTLPDCRAKVSVEKEPKISLSLDGSINELQYSSKLNITGNFTYSFKVYDMNNNGVLKHSAQISPPYDQPANGAVSLQGFVCSDTGNKNDGYLKNFKIEVASSLNGAIVKTSKTESRHCD